MFGKFTNNYYYGKSGKGDYQKDDLPRTRWQLFWEMLRVRFAAATSMCARSSRFGRTISRSSPRHFAFELEDAPEGAPSLNWQSLLDDPVLGPQWRDEVEVMRTHVARNRAALAAALAEVDGQRFATLGRQKGMFSRLPLSEAQVARLREEHAIYMVSDGRINLAGLDVSQAPRLARAVAMVL